MTEKKRILFVDDDRSVLDGLRRMLRQKTVEWKMEFVTTGSMALEVLRDADYDIVVSDLRMTEMDGVTFLTQVRDSFPDITRILLSGCTEQPLYGKAVLCAHKIIAKPCDADQLHNQLSRAIAIRDKIRSQRVSSVLSSLRSLPSMPQTYQNVIDVIGKPDCSCRRVGQMISRDIGMSAKILQVVNTALYGPSNKIADPVKAAVYLGLKVVKALVLTDGVFTKMPEDKVKEFFVEGLQKHCLRVGSLARAICKAEGFSEQQQEMAMMAGILHDTGKMVLVSEFTEQLREIIKISRTNKTPYHVVESRLLDMTHADLGGCLLNLWGLPNDIVEAATFHNAPQQCPNENFSVVSAVYVANVIDHQLCCGLGDGWSESIDMDYLERIGVADKWSQWQKMHLPVQVEEYEHVS